MISDLALFGVCAFTLFGIAKILGKSAPDSQSDISQQDDDLSDGYWGEFELQPDGSRRRRWIFPNQRHPSNQTQAQSAPETQQRRVWRGGQMVNGQNQEENRSGETRPH
jgi:hypothetical protein